MRYIVALKHTDAHPGQVLELDADDVCAGDDVIDGAPYFNFWEWINQDDNESRTIAAFPISEVRYIIQKSISTMEENKH